VLLGLLLGDSIRHGGRSEEEGPRKLWGHLAEVFPPDLGLSDVAATTLGVDLG
jgi:hypothetical protein